MLYGQDGVKSAHEYIEHDFYLRSYKSMGASPCLVKTDERNGALELDVVVFT
jgi:hypothetical protein